MERIVITFFLSILSQLLQAQNWGIVTPQVNGGYDVAYISELNTTYASGGNNIYTLRHDSVITSVSGPGVNQFRYFNNMLYAATQGTNSFRYFDLTWKEVPNVSLNARSFCLDTIDSNILILGEFFEPPSGHVVLYNGSGVSTVNGLTVNTNATHCATFSGRKFIAYESSVAESHLLIWDGTTAQPAAVPNNYSVASLFILKNELYATLFLPGYYQLWKYDGTEWQYVLKLPQNFYCQGVFNDDDQAIYFFGSTIYKCQLPDTTLAKIDNPITNSIYAMTKDEQTGYYYVSSNLIFWWDGRTSVSTNIESPVETPASFYFDTNTNTLHVDYDGEWEVYNALGQPIIGGKGIITRSLNYLPAGTYMISSKEIRWNKNKFCVAH